MPVPSFTLVNSRDAVGERRVSILKAVCWYQQARSGTNIEFNIAVGLRAQVAHALEVNKWDCPNSFQCC